MQHSKHHQGHASPLTMMTRRGAMKVSVATALGATLGPTLPSAFAAGKPSTNEKSVILLWLEGGPFQHESFDPKEHRQADKMGIQYKAIQTAVPGYRFASCLQQLTKIGGRITSIRSMVGSEMEHTLAQYHAQTGWRNTGSIQAPALGSIVSHELGSVRMKRAKPTGLPGYVSIGRDGYSSGYFGPEHKPTVVWDPNSPPENLGLPRGVSPAVFDRRLQLLQNVESARSDVVARQIRNGRESAVRFMRSKERVAFDLSKESDKTRDAYGRCRFGQGCLLARRLVESGVRFVQVTSENFDQHDKHYPRQIDLFEQLDHGMARLIVELEERGLLDNTIVVAMGEFGRTPKMNKNAGRDHWPNGYSIALAGGGFKPGYAYGSTTDDGQSVKDNPVSIPDFMATLVHSIGIDPDKEYHDQFKRPIKLVDDGKVIRDLLV